MRGWVASRSRSVYAVTMGDRTCRGSCSSGASSSRSSCAIWVRELVVDNGLQEAGTDCRVSDRFPLDGCGHRMGNSQEGSFYRGHPLLLVNSGTGVPWWKQSFRVFGTGCDRLSARLETAKNVFSYPSRHMLSQHPHSHPSKWVPRGHRGCQNRQHSKNGWKVH